MARDGIHPFLGIKKTSEGSYVVLFYEEDMGIVVQTEINNEDLYLGYHGEFDENSFEFLEPETDVILNNK